MIIYFDTEFTDFSDIKLISAGFVAEDGSEFYFECTDNYQRRDCSCFVLEVVLPHLDSSKYGLLSAQAASKLQSWLEGFNEQVQLASDAPKYDWPLILDLLEEHQCWPKNLVRQPLTVGSYFLQDHINEYFVYQPMAVRHHALWDARALTMAARRISDD